MLPKMPENMKKELEEEQLTSAVKGLKEYVDAHFNAISEDTAEQKDKLEKIEKELERLSWAIKEMNLDKGDGI